MQEIEFKNEAEVGEQRRLDELREQEEMRQK